jgi:hypothetical protein
MARADSRKVGVKVNVVTGQGSEQVTGELIGIRSDAIVLVPEGGAERMIAIRDISSIRVHRKSAALLGIALGAVAGGGAGYGISNAQYKDEFLGGFPIMVYTAVGVALGGLVGGLTGATAGADKTYDLTRMPAAEVDKLMAHLRKKARVPDYK